ncbi:lysozyme [Pedobacter sp. N23S346]|uniref:lysozyme n=1 Tax=Pedobacter sp. N23S346 TaxID=3402750 RepID=UPI003AD0B5B5
MNLDSKGIAFLHNEEGLRLNAYRDQIGKWTIAFGNTYMLDGSPVKEGDKLSLAEANKLFAVKIKDYEAAVSKGVKLPLTQNQFNALVSLCYNIGTGAFLNSTLLKKINSKASAEEIQAQFNLWKKGGGKVLPVLVNRRKREFKLFQS